MEYSATPNPNGETESPHVYTEIAANQNQDHPYGHSEPCGYSIRKKAPLNPRQSLSDRKYYGSDRARKNDDFLHAFKLYRPEPEWRD